MKNNKDKRQRRNERHRASKLMRSVKGRKSKLRHLGRVRTKKGEGV